jgi:hypothetical protein
MEEDDPKKAFECFEEAMIKVCHSIAAFCFPVCSRLMISISFLFMNEFAKAVENFIKSSELDDWFVFCHITVIQLIITSRISWQIVWQHRKV